MNAAWCSIVAAAMLLTECEGREDPRLAYSRSENSVEIENRRAIDLAPCHDGYFDPKYTPTCPHREHVMRVEIMSDGDPMIACVCLFKKRGEKTPEWENPDASVAGP
jgi:hypothetical protein